MTLPVLMVISWVIFIAIMLALASSTVGKATRKRKQARAMNRKKHPY